jgi:primase-polymerase (primpol)-like protein
MSGAPSERPHPPAPVDPRLIPTLAWMTEHTRWVSWRYQWREGKNGKPGKWTKPPRQPGKGTLAKNNLPDTWDKFDAAWADVSSGRAEGIGFMLAGLDGAQLAAIDLDDVRNPTTGAVVPWAVELRQACGGCYCEVTPSGAGLRLLGVTQGIDKLHRRMPRHPSGVGGFELYIACERYITITAR